MPVSLNRFQTRALMRLFKKMPIDEVEFEDSIDDGIMVRLKLEGSAFRLSIDMNKYGVATTVKKVVHENQPVQSENS